MARNRFDKTKPTCWYLMELVALDPMAYRCLQAHFKSRLSCMGARTALYNSPAGRRLELEVWDDIEYTKWFRDLGTGFGEGVYGL